MGRPADGEPVTERFPTDNDMQCAWDDYLEARAHAQDTLAMDDAIAAGKLWGRFMRMAANHVPTSKADNVIHVHRFQSRLPIDEQGRIAQ